MHVIVSQFRSFKSGYILLALLVTLQLVCGSDKSEKSVEFDEESGLIIGAGYELVKDNCQACHSIELVKQNRADYDTWLSTIRWMQKTQGLWEISEEDEKSLITYLAKHYGPDNSGGGNRPYRRKQLRAELMPKM